MINLECIPFLEGILHNRVGDTGYIWNATSEFEVSDHAPNGTLMTTLISNSGNLYAVWINSDGSVEDVKVGNTPNGILAQGTNSDTTKITGLDPNTSYQYVVDGSSEFTGNWDDSSTVISTTSDGAGVIDNIYNVYGIKYIHLRLTPSSPVQNLLVDYSVIYPS